MQRASYERADAGVRQRADVLARRLHSPLPSRWGVRSYAYVDTAPAQRHSRQGSKCAPSVVQFVLGVNGIGDVFTAAPAVMALDAARGGSRDTVQLVVKPWLREWALLIWPLVATRHDEARPALHLNPDGRAELELRFGVARHEAYARAVGCAPHSARVTVTPDDIEWAEKELAKHKRPVVALSPFSAYQNRQWPLSRWLHLEDHLRTAGFGLIVLDGPGRGRRLRPFLSTSLWGMAPRRVAALVSQVDAVIANDSGLAHLAGTEGTPCVAICGPTRGSLVFSWYESVSAVQSPFPCSPCYWRPLNGYHRACELQCDSLAQVPVADVAAALESSMARERTVRYVDVI